MAAATWLVLVSGDQFSVFPMNRPRSPVETVSFSLVGPPSPEFLEPHARLKPHGSGLHLSGSLPSSRRRRVRPLPVGCPSPHVTFRPQAFSTSRRFAPRSGLRACFIPLPREGFSRSGVSPGSQPSPTHRRCEPPCRWGTMARDQHVHQQLPRLRGVAPWIDTFLRLGVTSPLVVPLFGFHRRLREARRFGAAATRRRLPPTARHL